MVINFVGKKGNHGKINVQGEEIGDNKFDIFIQLSANNLDKKDFFGKVWNHSTEPCLTWTLLH